MKRIEYKKGLKFKGTVLTYIEDVPSNARDRVARFKCDCGVLKELPLNQVKAKRIRSCGCKAEEYRRSSRNSHNASSTKEYRIYRGMLTRCYNKKDPAYPYYGGIGVKMCESWLGGNGFKNFFSDMGFCPEGKSLDRINFKGDYSPENCRWADKSIQAFNQKRCKLNTTGRTGVEISYIRKDGTNLYRAYINVDGKVKRLITTTDFELACFCRQEAELHYYGFIKE